jgi:hypothetical protein
MSSVSEERAVPVAERKGWGRGRAALAVAVVAATLVFGVLIGRSTATAEGPVGLAPAEVSSILRARVSAVNGDAGESEADIGAFYSRRAVLEEYDQSPPLVHRGRDEIASYLFSLRSMSGFSMSHRADAIQVGPYVAEGLGWTGGEGIVVYQLDADNRIAHAWVIGGRPTGDPGR